jgi:hypothetical protein
LEVIAAMPTIQNKADAKKMTEENFLNSDVREHHVAFQTSATVSYADITSSLPPSPSPFQIIVCTDSNYYRHITYCLAMNSNVFMTKY